MKKNLVVLLLSFVAVLSGCASDLSGDSYSRSEVRRAQQVEYGEIISLRTVQIEGTKSPVGAGAGAVVGGVGGSTLGGGKGSTIMAVIGAVAGGMAGAAVEEGVTRSQGVEITVKLDSGRIIAIVQGLSPHEKFAVGDQVRVLTSRGTSRVAQ
jgi:outer membrane lipoprotein SlyB